MILRARTCGVRRRGKEMEEMVDVIEKPPSALTLTDDPWRQSWLSRKTQSQTIVFWA